jgi:hypothetical protein
MNPRMLSILVIGAVLGLATGFAVNTLAHGSVFIVWLTGRTWQDAVVWLVGGVIVAVAVAYLRGQLPSSIRSAPRR